ncbi:hypothetical protein FLL45_04930 [Aliikangiella marina]|uniref:TIGR03016 family PEP-CTERM system-associated outer membrane protein n=1 Tax=Aliikangiella marina TaxID=1712262 RepID=A0A545TJ84_9GAMM|nr:hypothetical protein [Aliikangiella marina]TQV77292.1 hypothetical protein FLL45_04930 [Aliikangiella marina]
MRHVSLLTLFFASVIGSSLSARATLEVDSLATLESSALLTESDQTLDEELEEGWSDEWVDEWAADSPHSFLQQIAVGYATITQSDAININDEVLNEFRYTLDYQYQNDDYRFDLEFDLLEDWLLNETEIVTRDFNLSTSIASQVDLKIGRQVITWGTGDLLFLNDLFAKDWQSFFSGREDKYLKPAVDAIRLSVYSAVNFEVALLPNFTPDNVPNGNRLSFFIPGFGITQPSPPLYFLEPQKPEVALRLFSTVNSLEWGVYAYSGYFKSPTKVLPDNQLSFAEMTAVGASLSLPAAGGILNFETSYYRSDEDTSGDNPFIGNSQFRLLVGYDTELVPNLKLATQAYLERILDYQSLVENALMGQVIPDENRTMLTARFTYLALQQTLTNSLMVFYSPSDDDHYLRYSSRYSYSDSLKLTLGLNLIDGKEDSTFLAQMQDNSNAFVRINYSF